MGQVHPARKPFEALPYFTGMAEGMIKVKGTGGSMKKILSMYAASRAGPIGNQNEKNRGATIG